MSNNDNEPHIIVPLVSMVLGLILFSIGWVIADWPLMTVGALFGVLGLVGLAS